MREKRKRRPRPCAGDWPRSPVFTHLVKFGVVEVNPVRDVERPAVNRREDDAGVLAEAGACDS